MYRLAIFCILLLNPLFNIKVQATDFHNIQQWNNSQSYRRGDVIRHDYDIYISLLPHKNKRKRQTN
ncbi:hypothetical protein KO507_10965, partial [Gilvimarinus agarilyticus]|uniref:hypothetical protein n=1 Tax=Gilvimarinus sp. 2_MG-2023 TaxID=3062666 RepID=UPI001C080AC8